MINFLCAAYFSTRDRLVKKRFFDAVVKLYLSVVAGMGMNRIDSCGDGAERFSYAADEINPATRDFICTRKGDPRERAINDTRRLSDGDIFYLTCIDEPEKLKAKKYGKALLKILKWTGISLLSVIVLILSVHFVGRTINSKAPDGGINE